MALNSNRRTIFINMDGIFFQSIPFNVDPLALTFFPEAIVSIQKLSVYFDFILVSNQPGIAFGFFSENELIPFRNQLGEMFKKQSLNLKDFYYCPHHPFGHLHEYSVSCECRTPGSLLLEQAAMKHHLALAESWIISDRLDDIEAGNRVGCSSVFIGQVKEYKFSEQPFRKPDFLVDNLLQATDLILKEILIEEWIS